ncbi:DNA-binding transcriptional regulator, XRE-family HTH domain [bacterium A37T11]|nr:DNA-binding transcriptional regulator, XRE-family HTH domain [bacterium A37T11]
MSKINGKPLDKELEELLKSIGEFIRRERKILGYSSAETFGNKIDIDSATMRKYESGSLNISLKILLKIFRGLNKTKEEIFSTIITGTPPEPAAGGFVLSPAQEEQVKGQVKKALGKSISQALSPADTNRLYLMLTYCHNARLRKSALRDKFGLSKYTVNFNKLLKLTLDAGWISMTNPASPHDKDQRYFTTVKGVAVIKL